ncbi:MAG: CDP-glycerol glycerophosphotransferase family protein [Flavobacteriaceae bacterium]|nr:CDP-glycerol glycerophosphotransferase family protein [Flavobacteriaceae bacterium]
MKVIFFCQNPYAFGILAPIMKVLKKKGYEYIWFIGPKIDKFPFDNELYTREIKKLRDFKSDAIFVPGNEVPHYLRGVKTQVFHGLAGEKKGHFRIRHYFDLYLTQGPFFTNKFNELKGKYNNFEVIETGWPKLDIFGENKDQYQNIKEDLLKKYKVKKIVLYAPTFSPSLTSAPYLTDEIKSLASEGDYLVICKFHDLMSNDLINTYKDIAEENDNIIYETERNITKFLLISDILISDTSSVVYEFLLLNKPVLTFKNNNENIFWDDVKEYTNLKEGVESNLGKDSFKDQRKYIMDNYHPYSDGKSAERMVEAVEDYIQKYGVPEKRKLSMYRKLKIKNIFG